MPVRLPVNIAKAITAWSSRPVSAQAKRIEPAAISFLLTILREWDAPKAMPTMELSLSTEYFASRARVYATESGGDRYWLLAYNEVGGNVCELRSIALIRGDWKAYIGLPKGAIATAGRLRRPSPTKRRISGEASGSAVSAFRMADASPPKEDQQLVPVWYCTNREPVKAEDPQTMFSNERSKSTWYGRCDVFVPVSHRIGSVGSNWFRRMLTGKDDRLRIVRRELQTLNTFWTEIKSDLAIRESDLKTVLLIIHGYNVSFDDAIIRAAQLGFDLSVCGITAAFCWPSKGQANSYMADEATIGACDKPFSQFVLDILEKSSADRVHVVAHSMGNRGLLRAALLMLKKTISANGKIGQMILAAPDVDADEFRAHASSYSGLCERATLYISSKDKAVGFSKWLHAYDRAGYFPPVTVVKGVDTVEVGSVDASLLGHSYFAEARDLLHDIHDLIRFNSPPGKRLGLQQKQGGSPDESYWALRP